MRNNKDKWSFYNVPMRQSLTAEEVMYWKTVLSRILKIGIEFEFNLPEKKNGTCKGDSPSCPCEKLAIGSECWQECLNIEHCSASRRSTESCKNRTDTCETEDCGSCQHFALICDGIFCTNFLGACTLCEHFKVNCESCTFKFDPEKSPDTIRKHLNDILSPNNSYGEVSSSGVHSITTDGSLLGKKGAEIITVGRRVGYWEFYKMTNNILTLADKKGAYLNERCSFHMHALASYYGKVVPGQEQHSVPVKVNEMEREMPEIILANLHQLVRRYQNAMTWMMMGLNEPDRMTRWEKFRVSVLPISAVLNHMRKVQEEVSQAAGGQKYGWINYNQVEFARSGNVSRFHVEFRAADGLMSASAVSALACMYYALVLKAVEISRYGVVEIGDQGWMGQAQEVKAALLNNMKSYQDGDRFGDTRHLHKYYEILISESMDLVRQLKAILIKIGPAYEVLEKLAERPIALRRCDGESWEKIEKDLQVIINDEGRFDVALSEIIELNQVAECKDIDEWVQAVGSILRQDPVLKIDEDDAVVEDNIRTFVDRNRDDGKIIWSGRVGAPLLI